MKNKNIQEIEIAQVFDVDLNKFIFPYRIDRVQIEKTGNDIYLKLDEGINKEYLRIWKDKYGFLTKDLKRYFSNKQDEIKYVFFVIDVNNLKETYLCKQLEKDDNDLKHLLHYKYNGKYYYPVVDGVIECASIENIDLYGIEYDDVITSNQQDEETTTVYKSEPLF